MKTKQIIASLLGVASLVAATACGGDGGKVAGKMYFLCAGTTDTLGYYNAMVKEFNETVGAENNFEVKVSPKPQKGYETFFSNQITSSSGADVLCCLDENFKMYSQYYECLDNIVSADFTNQFTAGVKDRYRYNLDTGTSNSTDPLYALPVYNNATVLYYNKTALKNVGVICISVEEENLDGFNAGGKDNNGKTKTDYGIPTDVTVPAKGFYRSISPFVKQADKTDGTGWVKPAAGEIMIFNERISMNWDEIEDVAMLTTKTHNPQSPTEYGFYTEWWFNYAWTVGGDCLEDKSGNGDWVYTHANQLNNYIVAEDRTYVGAYTGKTYTAGQTIEFIDILDVERGDTIKAESDGSYSVGGSKVGVHSDVLAKVATGDLITLPSTAEAFSRFVMLAGVGGLNICPYPDAFVATDSIGYFSSNHLAFIIERSEFLPRVERDTNGEIEWGIAELPQYKLYQDPSDPNCDTTVVKGVKASHSNTTSMVIRKGTKVKERASIFVKWMATEGQKVLAERGMLPSTTADIATFKSNFKYGNSQMLADAAEYETAGDWWYLKDSAWINVWADPLNIYVRYGKMSLSEFLTTYVDQTNQKLASY